MFSNYILEKQTKSHCPKCEKLVWLLMHKTEGTASMPAFYFCPDCVWVGQVGVGPVLSARSYCRVDVVTFASGDSAALITCLVCGHRSSHPRHVEELYCPECRIYHADRALAGENPERRLKPLEH